MNKYELRNPNELKPSPNNSRTHSAEQVDQIVESIKEWGFTNPILIDESDHIIAGHGRTQAAIRMSLDNVPTIVLAGLTQTQKRAYVIADNQLAMGAGWDLDMLKAEMQDLDDLDFDLDLIGFDDDFLNDLIGDPLSAEMPDDNIIEAKFDPITHRGDVWILGDHRVMCGDSTSVDDVEKLMNGQTAALVHADPPYGMGKESDGVVNDNLYREQLDDFQMDWWSVFRSFTHHNGSVYIWGNAPDLWRLWYTRLCDTEILELKNQIVWDKKAIPGMKSDLLTQYPITTEHCLFIQIGQQLLGNVNTVDFPPEFDPILDYLKGEADAAGIKPKDVQVVCGCGMYSHWFSKSQFTLIPKKHYQALNTVYGKFTRPWNEIKAEWDKVKGVVIDNLDRAYFDNGHDIMRDVWDFPRVTGDERHDHATPKPVAMMRRVMVSSLPAKGLCAEPFGGSGSTLMGAEISGRRCYTMELQSYYCDIMIRRWQEFTKKEAFLESTGETYRSLNDAAT